VAGAEVTNLVGACLDVGEKGANGSRDGVYRALVQESSELTRRPADVHRRQQGRPRDRPHPVGGASGEGVEDEPVGRGEVGRGHDVVIGEHLQGAVRDCGFGGYVLRSSLVSGLDHAVM
jgi:hypothetical protein